MPVANGEVEALSVSTPSKSPGEPASLQRGAKTIGSLPRAAELPRPRQINRKYAPSARQVAHVNLASVGFHASSADGEPESKTRTIGASLFEGLEQCLDPSGRKASTLVLNIDENSIGGDVRLQRDVTPNVSELEGVLQEVAHRRSQDVPVNLDFGSLIRACDRQLMVDWRFVRAWTMQTTVGDQGSALVDVFWQHRYCALVQCSLNAAPFVGSSFLSTVIPFASSK